MAPPPGTSPRPRPWSGGSTSSPGSCTRSRPCTAPCCTWRLVAGGRGGEGKKGGTDPLQKKGGGEVLEIKMCVCVCVSVDYDCITTRVALV